MNFLPLLQHELRLAIRRKLNNQRVRMACSLTPVAVALWLILVWSAWTPTAVIGLQFQRTMAVLGLVGSLLGGMLLAADTLSKERREGTLQLLFLTPLTSGDILFGKLMATMLMGGYALLGSLPGLLLSSVLGGTSPGQYALLFIVWLNALFVTISVNLLASAATRRQRDAHLRAAGIVLFLAAIIPLLGTTLSMATGQPFWRNLSFTLSPTGLWAILQFQIGTSWFWAGLGMNQVVAWTAVALAHRLLRRARNDPEEKDEVSEVCLAVSRSSGSKRYDQFCAGLRREKPMEWFACRIPGHGFSRLIWPILGAGVLFYSAPDPFGNYRGKIAFVLFLLAQIGFKVTVAAHAVYAFAQDRRTGALESLLSTPIDPGEVTSGMFRGFLARFGMPVLAWTAVGSLATGQLFLRGASDGALVLATATVMLIADSYCGFWVGLYEGLAARHPGFGLVRGVIWVLVLPAVWFAGTYQIFWRSSTVEFVILWFLLTPVNHIAFVVKARESLSRYLRTLALRPFGEKPPILDSNWSAINWEVEDPPAETVANPSRE